ncbi:uncharacterized protein [Nicotiana sylvestris]|uniref:uncharacterized protein isoform X5 n=1 Tax=Nicotiana sylvestris TaxID=4096 RepID=UPI00388C39D0
MRVHSTRNIENEHLVYEVMHMMEQKIWDLHSRMYMVDAVCQELSDDLYGFLVGSFSWSQNIDFRIYSMLAFYRKAWLLDKMPQDVLAACIGKSTEKFQSVVLAYHAIGDRGNSACQISRSQAWTEERRCQVCYRNYAAAR